MKTKHPVRCLRSAVRCLLALFLFFLTGLAQAQVVGIPLSIFCPPDQQIWTCTSNRVWQYPAPTVIGGCPGVEVICQPPSGTEFPLGSTTVRCRAIDSCGNTAACSFQVTVRPDIEPPRIECPPDQTVLACRTATGGCGALVPYPAPLADDNSGQVSVICNPPSGSFLQCGETVVTCVAEDRCGNRAACRFTVSVREGGQPPSIQCPSGGTITTCSNSAVLNYPLPTVNPPGTTVICIPPSGTVLPLGGHVVSCVASNPCGVAECKFEVAVRGQGNPPQIRCPDDLLVTTCSNSTRVFYVDPVVLPAGTAVTCQPPSGSPFPLGETSVLCVASNQCGSAECKFVVTVRRTPPPIIRCPTNDLTFTIPCGSNCVPVNYPAPAVLNGSLESCFPRPGTCLPEGIHPVICRATNDCGTAVCEFVVRVVRDQGEPPIIRCPQDQVLTSCSNCAPLVFPKPVVLNGTLVACDPPAGTCLPVGEHVVRCLATNDCGRAACEFRVKVVRADDGPPRLSIVKDGDDVIVCWTKTCRCFKLQGARNLNPPIQWIDLPVDPVDVGERYCVRIPITLRMQFFRLVSCDQSTAIVYDVTGLPITRAAAGRLIEALGLSPDKVQLGDGSVRFLDPLKFQAVPTKRITDPALIGSLIEGSEDKGDLAFEAFDLEGLKNLRAIPGDAAVERFTRALRIAELLPANADASPRHTLFEAHGANGESIIPEKPIDTRVNFQFELGGIPLIGPGAKLNIAFSPEGEPTSLLGSFREHKPFREIPIISPDEAARRCQQRFPHLGARISPRLVYYAPSLLLPAVQKITPCYECGGEGTAGSESVKLLRNFIPATDDLEFTPALVLDAGAEGTLVNARAVVRGGTPPYVYQWVSSSVDLGGQFAPDAASIEYNANPRDESRLETVRVIVTDANGVQVQASRVVVLGPGIGGGLLNGLFAPAVAGVADYGIERGVSDLCAGQQAAFNARMMPAGYTRQFNFAGLSAWERDFKQGGTGLDHVYVDNADLTFYMGHGYGGGFTFEGNHDDGDLFYTDAVKAWGNKDLEWLALLSCSVMADTYDGKSCFGRWAPTFDGLHLMMGFANTAYDSDGFAGTFADWMLGRFGILPPMPVRSSWLLATDSNQPGSVIASILGVIGPAGMSNYNDYYHGRGPVGPDLRGSDIRGYWRIKY